MPEENPPQQNLEMRVAALEDKLRKIFTTEEELKALNITEEELKTFQKVAAALAQRYRPPCCNLLLQMHPPCCLQIPPPYGVGYPVPWGAIGFGSLGS